ncbi:unnamed protein product [Brassica rapa subsp. trilocularis]
MSKYNGAEGIIASFSFILFVLSWILWSTRFLYSQYPFTDQFTTTYILVGFDVYNACETNTR